MPTDTTKRTQTDKVLDYMRRNGSITQFDALLELGCMRLASRINDLRNRGLEIATKMIDVATRSGTVAKIACYKLEYPN